jgi:hypothetical protein
MKLLLLFGGWCALVILSLFVALSAALLFSAVRILVRRLRPSHEFETIHRQSVAQR